MNGALEIRDLAVRQAHAPFAPVLRGVSLTVGEGRIHGLVGESGAGKSTVGKAALGVLPQALRVSGGEIRFDGVDLLKRRRAPLALIPQDPMTALNPSRRLAGQLCDGMRLRRGLPARAAYAEMRALLEDVRLPDPDRAMRSYPHELSGGQRQRALIAAAFAMDPRCVIADEPTTALDVTVQKRILRLIREMQRKRGVSMLFIAHDLGVVAQICDEVSVIYGGMIVDHGPAAEVFANPAHPYTRALIEASPRHDKPAQSLRPVDGSVFEAMDAAVADYDRRGA